MKILVSLAVNSFKEIIRQPFYYVVLLSGCLIILMSWAFTFFAFGEEARMIRDMGVSTITICGFLCGCLSSSVLIANEFERQTVLAVLCKPIARIHYVLGKYIGIILAATVLMLSQGLILEITLVINKYNKILSGLSDVSGLIDYACLLGIYLSVLQVLIIAAVSLVLSLYLNTAANLTICLLVFILCHTFSYALPLHSYGYNTVSTVISTCYALFPNFQNLNLMSISGAVAGPILFWQEGAIIQYVIYNTLYTTIYCMSAVWLAVVLFKRREIA